MVTILNKERSLFNNLLAEVRDQELQKDGARFRSHCERMGEIFGYEISKQMPSEVRQISTPLGIAEEQVVSESPVIVSVMRAGVPLHMGLLRMFHTAGGGFVSLYRNHDKDGSFQISLEYLSCPDIQGKTVILCDALIASGSTITLACKALLTKGTPKHIHIVSLIASREGLAAARKKLPAKDVSFWLGAVDDELTVKSYIVPGLGDAGDLAFGEKTT
jgi:uracil phosphoribosyltransferase